MSGPSGGRRDLADPLTLLGRWDFERTIEDRREQERHRITGSLVLEEVGGGRVRWQESGRWQRSGGAVEVSRTLWLEAGGDGWWVRFEDGRDFHPWQPGVVVVHPCAPDRYEGLVEETDEGWTVRWEVTGPRKDYSMTTRLRPALG